MVFEPEEEVLDDWYEREWELMGWDVVEAEEAVGKEKERVGAHLGERSQ